VGGAGEDRLDGGDATDTALFGDSATPVTVDLNLGLAISATTGRDTLKSIEGAAGTAANDTFIGNGLDNAFFGGAGNDTFVFTSGIDYLEGGEGTDIVTGLGLRQDHALSFGGGEGHIDGTTARGVERFEFDDGRLVTGVQDTAAQMYRLYHAVLDRNPDGDGFRNWNDSLEAGTPLKTVADGFTNSVEFQARYGSLDNPQFVSLLYANALDRAPDAEGLGVWIDALNAGVSRSQVVLGFSESAELIEKTRSSVEAGLWLEHDLPPVAAEASGTLPGSPSVAGTQDIWAGVPDQGTPEINLLGIPEPQEHGIRTTHLTDDGFWLA
jgi:hypothetical protein